MKKEVDMEIHHQPETHTQFNRALITAESYPMKMEQDHRRPSQQMDSSHSASPTATTPPRNITNNVQEAGRVHALPDDRSLANSGEPKFFFIIFITFQFDLELS
jgi:hypothetical protein